MPNAIITGATHGMGKAIAEKLLHEGFSIAVCARSKDNLHLIQSEWNEKYPTASILSYAADMTNKDEVASFADSVLSNFPEVDLLVNNAGMFIPGPMTTAAEGDLEKMMGLNLYAAYHLCRRIAPVMKEQKSGHIFNICSIAGLEPHPGSGAYSITKYALVGLSANLRAELQPFNVKVTAICPGSTNTSSWDGEDFDPSRLLDVSDIANTIWSAYSLSPQASMEQVVIRPVKD